MCAPSIVPRTIIAADNRTTHETGSFAFIRIESTAVSRGIAAHVNAHRSRCGLAKTHPFKLPKIYAGKNAAMPGTTLASRPELHATYMIAMETMAPIRIAAAILSTNFNVAIRAT
jgi:hypothetical protein